MKKKLDFKFVQYDRHNLMNDLQLIYGFLQMDRPKEAMKRTEKLIDRVNNERNLLKANLPHLSYLLIMFNYSHEQIRLSYLVNTEKDLRKIDLHLCRDTECFLNIVKEYIIDTELYNITVHVKDLSTTKIKITFVFENFIFEDKDFLKKCKACFQSKNFKVEKKDKTHCTWTYNI